MKKLSGLLNCDYDINIVGIAEDSRLVKEGYLFVCTKGFNVDHFDYIDDAIKNGAVAVVADRNISISVPLILVNDIDLEFVELCQKFYDVDVSEFKFIGITGTDGKTTTASIIRQLLLDTVNIAYIGTNGVDVSDVHFSTNNTTPCVFELYGCLSKIKNQGCKTVVMEVSSEALLHKRVRGLKFDVIAFTNITEDHLNVHGNIENYCNAKFSLVNYLKSDGYIFINGDDANCRKLTDNRMSTFGFNEDCDFTISNVKFENNLAKFSIVNRKDGKHYRIISPFLANYNIYNVTLAFLIASCFEENYEELIFRVQNLETISGRCERLDFGQNFDIILDYAHTLNGISCILDSVKGYNKIYTVTGAAGGREKDKRSNIGKVVLEKSDMVIFTMDDPRFEKVEDIISEMLSISDRTNYEIIIDRKGAIYRAFALAKEGDVVLILGKGRDNYMAIGDKKISYCDYDVIKGYFN